MNIIQALIIGASTNLDNLCIAMAVGSRGPGLSRINNLCISLISALSAYLACALAGLIIPTGFAAVLGSCLIIGVGVWTVVSALIQRGHELAPKKEGGIRSTIVLGAVLAVNCMPVAFGAGALGLSAPAISICIFAFSYLSMALGSYLGKRLGTRFNERSINILSGALLIVLGLVGLIS